MRPAEQEVLRELDRLERANFLSPQERNFLRCVVRQSLSGKTAQLYQKALAVELDIDNAKQIGVVATRVRAKLEQYYRTLATPSAVRIELAGRGYEVRFSHQPRMFSLDEPSHAAVANAKMAIDQRSLPGANAALKFLDRALKANPDHSKLLALKAYCQATRALYGTLPIVDLRRAEQLVDRTRSSTPRPWESWFAEACVRMALYWDWAGAEHAFHNAMTMSGGEVKYQPWYTAYLACQGRAPEAVALLRVAVSRSYDSPVVRADLASALIHDGQLDEAQATITEAIGLFGERAHYLLYVHLSILLEARGDARGALAAIQKAPLTWPKTAITLGFRALYSGLAGDRSAARRHSAKLRTLRAIAGRHVPAGQVGLAVLGTGDVAGALSWLRRGAEVERDPNFILSNVYPFFRHLHHEPAFRALMSDMGLKLQALHLP